MFKAKAAKWVKAYARQQRRPRISLSESQVTVRDTVNNRYVIAPVQDGRIRQVGPPPPDPAGAPPKELQPEPPAGRDPSGQGG